MATYDLVIIGTGPGGYVCAIRAAQLGMKVAVVEKNATLGGTCLNIGCMPSKALLYASEMFEEAGHSFAKMGVSVSAPKLDLPSMMNFKQQGIDGNVKGVEFLMKKNRIDVIAGKGKILGTGRVEVSGDDGIAQLVETKNIIIATGSDVARLKGIEIDERRIVSSTGALALDKVPEKLLVIGAGVIGLELGSVWRRLGAEVTVLEALPAFLGAADEALAKEAAKLFKKQGLDIHLGVKIGEVKTTANGVSIAYTDKDGNAQTLDADRLIVSVGRVPNTDNLGLEAIGLKTNERGFIDVDDHCRTAVPNVYAIGDVVRGPMLAHKAEDEGVLVAEVIDGQKPHIDYNCIPWVIYTYPEIAWVGKTEQQLKAEGREIKTGKFPFSINGRALGMNAPDGFVKMIADAKTDELLGVHVIAANASDLIAEAVVAMEFKAASEDIARICHPHPSMSEVMREAALAVDKRSLNS